MSAKTIARIIASAFFIGWLGILYAGADHPPPPGFILFVLFDLVAAWLIERRSPVYLNWHRTQRKHHPLQVILEGLAAGLVMAALTKLYPSASSRLPNIIDTLIWFTVVGIVGSFNALAVYVSTILLSKMWGALPDSIPIPGRYPNAVPAPQSNSPNAEEQEF